MREILFRAKPLGKIDSDFVYGSLGVISTDLVAIYQCKEFVEDTITLVDIGTVGQYTDLTDKNGTKIFEGDILKVKTMWHAEYKENPYGFIDEVIKKDTYWSVEYKNFSGDMGFMVYGIDRRWHTKLTWNKLYNAEAEIVGNIYDNPELLNEVTENDKR